MSKWGISQDEHQDEHKMSHGTSGALLDAESATVYDDRADINRFNWFNGRTYAEEADYAKLRNNRGNQAAQDG